MQSQLSQIGILARRAIHQSTGEVIAVFNSSLYLENSKTKALACVGNSKLIDGPINARTISEKLPALHTGMQWHCYDGILRIGNSTSYHLASSDISEKDSQAKHQPLIPENKSSIDPHVVKLLESFTDATQHQSNINQHINDHLTRELHTLKTWLQSDRKLPPQKLLSIIGCGEGLTPSGDDILIGSLIALRYSGCTQQFRSLSNWVKTHAPDRTNRISLAHLLAACEGFAVSLLHNLIDAVIGNDIRAVQRALFALDRYGHNSGRDAVCGVFAVMSGSTKILCSENNPSP